MINLARYNGATAPGPAPFVSDFTPADLLSVLRRRIWLILPIMALGVLGGFILSKVTHKTWRAEAELVQVERPVDVSSAEGYDPPAPESIDSQVAIMSTPAMVQKVNEWFTNEAQQTGEPIPPELATLGNSLTVTNPKNSTLLTLTVDAPSRADALTLANGVSLAFVQWKKEIAQHDIQDTETRLVGQVADAKTAMDNAVQAEYQYRSSHGLVNVGSQELTYIGRVTDATTAIDSLNQELASDEAQLDSQTKQLNSIDRLLAQGGRVRDDSLVISLQQQLSQIQGQRADEAQKVTKFYPGILPQLDSEIAYLKSRISDATSATAHGLLPSIQDQDTLRESIQQLHVTIDQANAKLSALTSQRDQAQSTLASMPSLDTTLSALTRNVLSATENYNTLQNALAATRLRISSTNGNVQLLESAVAPLDPYKPNLLTDLGLGALVGFLVCFGTLLVLEQAQRRVHTIGQLENYRLAPLLGVLPTLSRGDVKAIEMGQWTQAASESFAILRTNLLEMRSISNVSNGFIIMMTSAGHGEGKSLILSELARSIADDGLRVIVVDANLRTPAQHEYFPSHTRLGIATVLTEEWNYRDLTTEVSPNLEVIHSGGERPDLTRFISSPKMLNFLAELRSRADIILIDTPPCCYPDPLLLAPNVDQVVYVVGIAKTDETAVRGVLDALSGVAQVGIMVNYANLKHVLPYQFVNAASRMGVSIEEITPESENGLIRWSGPYQNLPKPNGMSPGGVIPIASTVEKVND